MHQQWRLRDFDATYAYFFFLFFFFFSVAFFLGIAFSGAFFFFLFFAILVSPYDTQEILD